MTLKIMQLIIWCFR